MENQATLRAFNGSKSLKTLITGANGHVGANLVRALLAQKREVRVLLHRSDSAIAGLDVERAYGDVLDPDSLDAAMEADVVHHLVAKINIDGTGHEDMLLTNVAGRKCGRRLSQG